MLNSDQCFKFYIVVILLDIFPKTFPFMVRVGVMPYSAMSHAMLLFQFTSSHTVVFQAFHGFHSPREVPHGQDPLLARVLDGMDFGTPQGLDQEPLLLYSALKPADLLYAYRSSDLGTRALRSPQRGGCPKAHQYRRQALRYDWSKYVLCL